MFSLIATQMNDARTNSAAQPTVIQVNNAAGTPLATYVYDYLGRRIQKTINDLDDTGFGGLTGDIPAGVTDYLYAGQQLIEQCNDASPGVWTQVNFWGQYIDELLFFSVPTPATYRVLSDLLYRSVALVTTSNVISEAYDTDAYGNTLCYSGPGTDDEWFTDDDVQTNNPINTTIFTGRQYDPESLIYWYRARYYSPQIGRFISRDPLRNAALKQGPNLYLYVKGKPATHIDARGFACCNGVQYEPSIECCNNNQVFDNSTFCPCGQDLEFFHDIFGNTVDEMSMNELIPATAASMSPFLRMMGMAEDAASWTKDVDPFFIVYDFGTDVGAFFGSWRCVPIGPADYPHQPPAPPGPPVPQAGPPQPQRPVPANPHPEPPPPPGEGGA